MRYRELFHLEEQTVELTKILCAKQFLNKKAKP